MSLFLANYYIAQASGAIPAIATLTNYKKVKTLLDVLFWDYDHISKEQPSLKRLPIKDRLKLNDATMVFKCINNLAPDYLENKFRFCSCIHDWQTHSASTLDIPFCHLSTGQKSTEEKNCGTHQAVILSLKNVPRNLSAHLLSCSKVHLIVLYFYSSDIYI